MTSNAALMAIKRQRELKKLAKQDLKWGKSTALARDLIENSRALTQDEKLPIMLSNWLALSQMIDMPTPAALSDCIFCCHCSMYIGDVMERPALRKMAEMALINVTKVEGANTREERKAFLHRFVLLIEAIDKSLDADSIPLDVMVLATQAGKATENIYIASCIPTLPAHQYFNDLLNGQSAKSIAAKLGIDNDTLLGQCEALTMYLSRINGLNEMYTQAIYANTFTRIKAMKKDLIYMLEAYKSIALKSYESLLVVAKDYGLSVNPNISVQTVQATH